MNRTIDSLCHVFVFVSPGAPEAEALREAGMVESFRRRHPGQGTANSCWCFDNAYLELLWVEDADELASPQIRRTGLAERSDWRRTGAVPFGIGLRGKAPFPTFDFRAPYLPEGSVIPVALASGDPRQPFIFRSPGEQRPDQWTDGRAGARQQAAGLAEIVGLSLTLSAAPSEALRRLERDGLLSLSRAVDSRMELTVSRTDGNLPKRLSLPDFTWVV